MEVRKATVADIEALAEVEALCFPKEEAASKESIAKRVAAYGDHFLLLFEHDQLIGFIDGMVTDEKNLQDCMYAEESMHNEKGAWQMIFGLDVIPQYRRQGKAAHLLHAFIQLAKQENRLGVVLTCKDHLVSYYAKFGFIDEGISESTHGAVAWHQMRLTFTKL